MQRTPGAPPRTGRRWWVWPLVALLALGAGYSGTRFLFAGPAGAITRPVTVLVMGIDEARSDVNIVARYDPKTQTVGLLSLPRDSMVQIPGRKGYDKINAAHAFGGQENGPKLAEQTVAGYLGVPIDYWVRLDFAGFARVITAMGGVEIDIPQPMDYDDPYQNLHIHFKPGRQTLDGQKALEYVRYRTDSVDPGRVSGSDIERESRQHTFLKAVLTTLRKTGTLLRLPLIIPAAYHAVSTNMPLDVATGLATTAKDLSEQNLTMGTVPGKGEMVDGVWYWRSTPQEIREAVDRYLINPPAPVTKTSMVPAA